MSQGVNVSVTKVAGEEKSRVMKKGFVLLFLVPAFSFMVAGTGYLLQSLLNYWFCVYCGSFNEARYSIFWFILSHGGAILGYFIYKWSKKNEENRAQKEALERAGKVAVLERLLEGGLTEAEIEEIREGYAVAAVPKSASKVPAKAGVFQAPNPDPVVQNPTLVDKLLRKVEEMQTRLDEKGG